MTITNEITEAIRACTLTVEVCKECASACETKGGMETCARLCDEAAAICEQHASNLKNGDRSKAPKCIAACEACAEECDKSPSMEPCARCAESCSDCADACQAAEAIKA
jgi:hypothetical protein